MIGTVANILLVAAAAYVCVGLLVAGALMVRGLDRLDSAASHAPLGFRVLVTPGLVALWPWVLLRWSRRQGGRTHDT